MSVINFEWIGVRVRLMLEVGLGFGLVWVSGWFKAFFSRDRVMSCLFGRWKQVTTDKNTKSQIMKLITREQFCYDPDSNNLS